MVTQEQKERVRYMYRYASNRCNDLGSEIERLYSKLFNDNISYSDLEELFSLLQSKVRFFD